MAKGKGQPGVQNRHIFQRVSYLYQAANYLSDVAGAHQGKSTQTTTTTKTTTVTTQSQCDTQCDAQWDAEKKVAQNVSRYAVSNLRAVSLKVMIRQSPDMKRTMCKFCDAILEEGRTCRSTIENRSKGGKKPWADVLVVSCNTCGNVKRYPVSASRQKRRHLRVEKPTQAVQKPEEDRSEHSGQAMELDQPT